MNNTISLKNAKKLHEVADAKGVELPDSDKKHFYGESADSSKYGWLFTNTYKIDDIQKYQDWLLPAYTTDELLEWLPAVVINDRHEVFYFSIQKSDDEYAAGYSDGNPVGNTIFALTPADALCLLAIELISKNIIK